MVRTRGESLLESRPDVPKVRLLARHHWHLHDLLILEAESRVTAEGGKEEATESGMTS